ncbi:MAG TPA: hypothetical protein VFM45_04505 [Anaeromyxobacteraceae bacterium]|nr:hypothetical protein [Anaeromyxobacteraceae bacterium]
MLAGLVWAAPARAWLWPEHRDIGVAAIQGLSPADRAELEALWASLKKDAGPQLCATLVSPGAAPQGAFGDWGAVCIDFPSYPAMGGDHACSSAELRVVTETDPRGLRVASAGEWSKRRLAEAQNEAARTDAWNQSHLAMQLIDPTYLTRAASNNAHFLDPRKPVAASETLEGYVNRALEPDAPINATAVYVQWHAIALRLAAQWRVAPEAARPDLARRALLAEGTALHFLQDSLASGHFAATWGDAAWQKGTHDLYCVQGLTSKTWAGDLYATHGDAHMTDHDLAVAGAVIGKSLAQLAGAAAGTVAVSSAPLTKAERDLEELDYCGIQTLPAMPTDPVAFSAALVTLRDSPIPSGDHEDIHPPRARADIGFFGGVVAGVGAGPAWGGFDTSAGWRFRSELEVGARVGYGLDGVLTTNMDGQLWAQASLVADLAQLDASCPGCPGGVRSNQALPRVPARSALKLAIRMPYYVVPFDLVVLGPVLLLVSPSAAQDVVFRATGGGLWTLQRPIATSLGTFQFMAGREVGFTLWGIGDPNQFIATPVDGPPRLVDFRQLELDFPVFEYVPPRAFATVLSLAAQVQLGFSVQLAPTAWLPQQNDAPYGGLGASWFVYLRLRLDARKYVGGSPEDWGN